MNNIMVSLTYTDIAVCLLIGLIIAGIYHFLLWQTVLYLPKTQHKKTVLFVSSTIRIFLLILTALYFSHENAGRFLLIFIGFVATRLIILNRIKKQFPSPKGPRNG